jgi:hypothetical protein
MRCGACDAELILTNVVPENTVAVRGRGHIVLAYWPASIYPLGFVPSRQRFAR